MHATALWHMISSVQRKRASPGELSSEQDEDVFHLRPTSSRDSASRTRAIYQSCTRFPRYWLALKIRGGSCV
jgi:hypothetical protein